MGKFLDAATDSGEQESSRKFLNAALSSPETEQAPPQGTSFGGAVDLATTALRGAVAEPVAGLAGIVQSVNPLAEEGAGARAVEATRGLIGGELSPEGQATLRAGIESIPESVRGAASTAVENIERTADLAAEKGGPAAGAAVKTLPAATLELIGLKGASSILRASERATKAGTKAVNKGISVAAPSADELKQASRSLFKELENSGVIIKSDSYNALVDDITEVAARNGAHAQITPASAATIRAMQELSEGDVSLVQLDTMRRIAQNAAASTVPADANIGRQIVESIDDYIRSLSPEQLTAGNAKGASRKFRVARELWGRARRSEMVTNAIEKARNQASGFENGIRIQLRSILDNPKKVKFFSKEERELLRKVVRGTPGTNIAKLVGRLGFSEGQATNIVGATIGAGAGGTLGGAIGGGVGGGLGAITVPLVGTVSRRLAQRMTKGSAEFLDQVIRAGNDGREIIKAYLKNTPKNERNAAEMTQLLLRPDINLPGDVSQPFLAEAIAMVQRARNTAQAGAGVAGAAAQNLTEQDTLPAVVN